MRGNRSSERWSDFPQATPWLGDRARRLLLLSRASESCHVLNTHGIRCRARGETQSTGTGQPGFAVVPHLELARNRNWQHPKQMKSKPSSNYFIESQTPDCLKLLDFWQHFCLFMFSIAVYKQPCLIRGACLCLGAHLKMLKGPPSPLPCRWLQSFKGWILKEWRVCTLSWKQAMGSVLICT